MLLICLLMLFIWCSSADAEASAEVFSLLVWRPTSVKTDDFFLCFNRATHLSIISIFTHPLLSSIMCFQTLPVVSQHALTSNADGKVILLTCALSLHLLHLFLSLWLSGIVSQLSTSRLHFRFFFTIHSQHLGLDWDLDSSRRLSNSSCPL